MVIMVIFHSYVSLPEGTPNIKVSFDVRGVRSGVVLRKARRFVVEETATFYGWKLLGGGPASLRLPWRWEAVNCILDVKKIQPG